MRLMLVSMGLIFAVALALGGRPGNLSAVKIKWPGLALVGFALQFVAGPGTIIPLMCLYLSFVFLTIFALANIAVAGFVVILLGIGLNFTVIGLNGGMPVDQRALVASGQADTLSGLIENPYPKHHLASDHDLVVFLGDVIPVPPPVGQAISIGDVFTYAGVGVVVVIGMRAPTKRRRAPTSDSSVGAEHVRT